MTNFHDVAVIGAGVSGLAAARALQNAGKSVVVFDKGRAPGGRVCTRFQDGCRFDHGAQNIKPEGTALGDWMQGTLRDELRLIEAPVELHQDGRIEAGDAGSNAQAKYTCQSGLARLGLELSRGLDVWLSTRVECLEEAGDHFVLRSDQGCVLGAARHVIVSAPGAQSADLLHDSDLREDASRRIEALRSVIYNRCLTVLLRYEQPLEADWYALLARDRSHPLLWLARENAKGGACCDDQTALIAQLGPQISLDLWDAGEDAVARQTAEWIGEILGREFASPAWRSLKKWRFSQSREPALWDDVNPPGAKIVMCGDALSASRVPDAYDTGLRASRQLLALQSS